MNEQEEKRKIRDAMNRSLSNLEGNPALAGRVLAQARKERPAARRRLTVGLVLAAVAVLASVAALAAGVLFSPRYDAVRVANQALKDRYGITDEMMTVFYRGDPATEPDGSLTFTYRAVEEPYANQIGVYTVTVKNGKAQATWSHDGESTDGGAAAAAWGPAQIAALCSDQYGEIMAALTTAAAPSVTEPSEIPPADDTEAAEADVSEQEQQAAWEKSKAQVEAAAKITLAEARALAISAVGDEYGLSDAQRALFVFDDDSYSTAYRFADGLPVVDLFLYLTQKDDGTRTEKDGIYVVTVNMDSGVIEDIIYDSGLAANG
jgi:hypothetical protein